MSKEQRAGGNLPLHALLSGAVRFVYETVIDPMRRHARRRAGARELARLDDRLLRDIGLSRSQVHAAAYGLIGPGERSPADSMRAHAQAVSRERTGHAAQEFQQSRRAPRPAQAWWGAT
jgi:uncharacterized protein YjiS (DUF1127 family)